MRAMAGDGGVVVSGGGRREEGEGVGLEVVAEVVVVIPLDAAALLLIHDWEQRRWSGVGSHVGELIAGARGGC